MYTVLVGLSIVITLRGSQLDLATQLPSEMKNTDAVGLMGNYDSVSSNDFISRYGQTIPADSTEEKIYYEFGETCESLFIMLVRPIMQKLAKNVFNYPSFNSLNHCRPSACSASREVILFDSAHLWLIILILIIIIMIISINCFC